jgi:hypothetical protein
MKPTKRFTLLIAVILFLGFGGMAQNSVNTSSKTTNSTEMKTYLIEREIAGAGSFTPEQLKAIAQKSCGVVKEIGPQIEWVHSYVTGDKIFCIYRATNEDIIREHAKKGGFPANRITEVASIFSPATAK